MVGVILAIALLTIPAATSRQWTRSLLPMMVWATAACAACTIGGFLLSWDLSARVSLAVPPGPLVILLTATLYAASSGLRAVSRGAR